MRRLIAAIYTTLVVFLLLTLGVLGFILHRSKCWILIGCLGDEFVLGVTPQSRTHLLISISPPASNQSDLRR